MRNLTIIVFYFFSLTVSAQTTFEKIVTRDGVYNLSSVIQTSDGGFAAMGIFNTTQLSDKWLVRTDAIGDTLWSQVYAGDEDFRSGDRYFSEAPDGGFTFVSYRAGKARLIHVDATGAKLWDKELFIGSSCAMLHNTSGYIIAGEGRDDTLQSPKLTLCKVSNSGDIEWKRFYLPYSFTVLESSYPQAIRETRQGGFVVAGNNEDWYMHYTPYLICFGPSGDSLWYKTYSLTGNDAIYSVDTTTDGSFIACGHIHANTTAFTIKVDNAGDTLWTNKNFSMTGDQSFYSILTTADGGAVVCGETSTNDYQGPDTNKVYLVKYSTGGTIEWERKITTAGNASGYCIKPTTDHGYIICGMIEPYTSMGGGLLIKTDANGNFTGTLEKEILPGYKVFPNPASEYITFTFPELTKLPLTITFYDLPGNEVCSRQVLEGQTCVTIETASWQPGLFMYVMRVGCKTFTGKICISGNGN